MSTPTIGFGPYKGPDRFLAGGGGATPAPTDGGTIIDPGTGKPTPTTKPTDATLTITGLSLTTNTYKGSDGRPLCEVAAVWASPTQGESDTDPYKVGHYLVSFTDGSIPGPAAQSKKRAATIRSLQPEKDVTVFVQAVTNAGIRGPEAGATIRTRLDATPPPTPSKPRVDGTFKGAAVYWDGLLAGGEPMPVDWRYVVVEMSLDKNFAPSSIIKAGFLFEAGSTATSPVGTSPFTVYARLYAVDQSGNRSAYSEVASGSSLQLLPPDIGGAAITKEHLAKGAVEAQAIAENAVTAFGLAPGSVGEVTLSNLAITAEKIKDGAISGIKIRAGAIDETKIVDGSIRESKLAALAITSEKLAANAVTLGKIGTNAVDNLALAKGSVNTENVKNDAITGDLLAQFAVKARAVGFENGGSNQLLNSSFEEKGDPSAPLPDTEVPHWESEQHVTLRRVTATGFHGTMALRTTFDPDVAVSPPVTSL